MACHQYYFPSILQRAVEKEKKNMHFFSPSGQGRTDKLFLGYHLTRRKKGGTIFCFLPLQLSAPRLLSPIPLSLISTLSNWTRSKWNIQIKFSHENRTSGLAILLIMFCIQIFSCQKTDQSFANSFSYIFFLFLFNLKLFQTYFSYITAAVILPVFLGGHNHD